MELFPHQTKALEETNHFIGGLNTVKERYTPREVIELTRDAYGGRAFREFFEKKGS